MKLLYDYHTHTVFSHGLGTIEENVIVAKQKGLSEIAITDHGFEHLAYPVKRKKLKIMREECDRLTKKYGIKVLLGIEANLLDKTGRIDIIEEDKKYLDIILMGYHKLVKLKPKQLWFSLKTKLLKTKKQIEENTDAYINAINKYNIKVLTHLNYGIKVNIKRLAKACKEKGVLIELNGKRINFNKEEIDYMKEIDTKFIVNSDAHRPKKVGETNIGFNFIIKNNIKFSNVVNIG
ncbi:MAG: PHP domain-containing protein [Clostridiales bacterium]|nr:PHP domain-containing protein [Clostridiales bacterium]